MNNLNNYLNIANKIIQNEKIDDYIPLYPMLRKENAKLKICLALVKKNDNVWKLNSNIKPKYVVLIDPAKNDEAILVKSNNIKFETNKKINNDMSKQKELSKYTVEKTLEYKNYLINDIKNEKLPIQKKLAKILGEDIRINGEIININEYILANCEEQIKEKVDELVNIVISSKYQSITYYYNMIFEDIIIKYKDNKYIDQDKMKLCAEIMNYYYDGVLGIYSIFNIEE